jgi:hypothetical protein
MNAESMIRAKIVPIPANTAHPRRFFGARGVV